MPTATASLPARSRCTHARDSAPVSHCCERSAGAIAPSASSASFKVTHGRRAPRAANANGALRSRAACSRRPNSTVIPAARNRSAPPEATGFGSRIATTTRATPAATSASTHGGVLPWWLHGSSVTKRVAARARVPAMANAATSACGPPKRWWAPSPTTTPSRTMTAPTRGFGAVCPQPVWARLRARRIHARSCDASVATAPSMWRTCQSAKRTPTDA